MKHTISGVIKKCHTEMKGGQEVLVVDGVDVSGVSWVVRSATVEPILAAAPCAHRYECPGYDVKCGYLRAVHGPGDGQIATHRFVLPEWLATVIKEEL